LTGNTGGQPNRFSVYGCGLGSQGGPENLYYIAVSSPVTISVRVLSYQANGMGNPDIFILRGLNNGACLAAGDGSAPGWTTAYLSPPGLYYLVVDGWIDWWGTYTLEVVFTADHRLFFPLVLRPV